MISSTHYLELYINNSLIELESQDSLNLRMNSVLFNPTKTVTTQADYSYSFDIPSTPHNDKALDYANNLSKLNKFHARYPAQVYADGTLIFDGSLTLQKYKAKEKMYTCNLVNIKVNTLDEIFGDMVLTDLHWDVPFSGAPTINSVNADMNTKYFFPLVGYGVFQKDYVSKDDVSATYTPKHDIDKYNKWWVESFYPSLNMLEIAKKAFETKGYKVGGTAYNDFNINGIYCSTNLSQEQAPIYNLGNPKFGKLDVSFQWDNLRSFNTQTSLRPNKQAYLNSTGGFNQDLKFPYEMVRPAPNALNSTSSEEYNFSTITCWNMMDKINNSGVTVNIQGDSYMLDPNEMVIVIPSDGWYKISLSANATLSGTNTTFSAKQWTTTYYAGDELKERDVTIKRLLTKQTPIEIQLIKNYDENIELIKGTKNVVYATGDPNDETYTYRGGTYTAGTYTNKTEWNTDFPHQNLYGSRIPTKANGLLDAKEDSQESGFSNQKQRFKTIEEKARYDAQTYKSEGENAAKGNSNANSDGYIHRNRFVMPYDQAVSQAFICGFSSMGDGTVSVQRNGKSWSPISSYNNNIFANVKGMDLVSKENGMTVTTPTDYCSNTYKDSPDNYCFISDTNLVGSVNCCVYLNKNDILEVMAIQRDFDGQKYACTANCEIHIEAISERTQYNLRADPNFGYYTTTEFPVNLNLFNFTNNETKVSDWLNNIQKAFNLEYVMDGDNVEINTNKGIKKDITYAVDIDNRVGEYEYESEFISYPKEMSVQYKIDTDEWGFELTVPQEHINDDDWKEWGDSGYTVIKLNDDSYETDTQNTQTQFSYTWYDNFNYHYVSSGGVESSAVTTITIPVIEKAEYMAEGYGYEEAMQHDGYSMTQRFWYRQAPSSQSVWLSSVLANGRKEYVNLAYPINSYNRFNLSYKDTETSIVSEYFNIHPMLSSNYATVECYLNPEEFKEIKGGALVKYDSDLYYTSELSGYDPSGGNPTKLKLIKKI